MLTFTTTNATEKGYHKNRIVLTLVCAKPGNTLCTM